MASIITHSHWFHIDHKDYTYKSCNFVTQLKMHFKVNKRIYFNIFILRGGETLLFIKFNKL